MGFLTNLFGDSGGQILTALFALGAVIVLILIVVWVMRMIFSGSGGAARGRNRRLAVVDTLMLDQKRQLVIIRRDDVEHLILTGGPQDMLVEAGIPVEEPPVAQTTSRRPVPTVPSQRRVEPAPAVAPAPAPTPAPAAPPVRPLPPAGPGTVLEQLRQSGHTGDRKTRVSLRHTGLLRPVDSPEPTVAGQNLDISAGTANDSGTQVAGTDSENDRFEHNPSSDPTRG